MLRSCPNNRSARKPRGAWDRMIIVVLALALAYFAVDKFVLSQRREEVGGENAIVRIEIPA
jgi:hypothetical protein